MAVAVAAVAVVAPVRPAAADPARPGNVRSFVVSVDPPTPGFTLGVAGGDAFLVLDVDPGHAVEVPGYQGEAYLRVGEDGTVEENQTSEAVYLNRSRYPAASLPAGVGPNAAPVWRHVGAGGSVAWHDHRVHWMGRGVPPPQAVTMWEVPLLVDGRAVVVHGRYERVSAPAAWPWWLATAVVTALLTLVTVGLVPRRRPDGETGSGPSGEHPLTPRLVLAGVVAVSAAALGLPVAWSLATGVGATGLSVWAGVALLAIAAVLAIAGAVLARRADPAVAGALVAGAGAALVVWAVRRVDVWSNAVLVSGLPATWDRMATAAALATGLAAVATGAVGALGPVRVDTVSTTLTPSPGSSDA
jgi:hypothetical protein